MLELFFSLPTDKRPWIMGCNWISNLLHLWETLLLFVSISIRNVKKSWSFSPSIIDDFSWWCDQLRALWMMMVSGIFFYFHTSKKRNSFTEFSREWICFSPRCRCPPISTVVRTAKARAKCSLAYYMMF